MKTLLRTCLTTLCAFACMLGTACSTIGFGDAGEPSVSPRWGVVAAAQKLEPVLDELTLLISAGAVSNNVTDDIAQFGPDVQSILAGYFDGAEACVAIGGALQTETATGRICSGGTLIAIYDQLDAKILTWAVKTGLDTTEGQVIIAGRLVLAAVPRSASAGVFRNEPDVPLADFQALRARLREKFETLILAADKHAARLTVAAPAAPR